jgi:excisionase family DNA binding protein
MLETFLTPDELSKRLKISRVWIYKLCDQGRIPFFRLAGKVIRFREEEIESWMEQGRGVKYHRDGEKEGAKVEGLPQGDASSGGENNRAPDTKTGAQNQGLEMLR